MDGKALSVVMKRTCARVRSYKALEQDAQTTLRSKCKSMEVGGWAMAWEKKKKKGQNVHHRWIDSAEVGWDERTDRIAEFVRVIVSIGDVPLCEELNRRRDTTRFDAGWRITGRACASRHRGGSANRCTEQHKA